MRLPRLPLAAASLVTLTLLAPASGHAAEPDPSGQVRVARVLAAADQVPDGTVVRASFRVNNRTGDRAPAGKAWLFLVRGDGHSNRIGTVATPRLPAGATRTVRKATLADPQLRPGRYALRVCLTPRPDGRCATSAPDVRIGPAELTATSTGDGSFASTVEMLSDSQDITFTNTGSTRTGRVALTQTGADAAEFVVFFSDCGASLDPGQSCMAQVGFLPADPGVKASALRLRAARGARAVVALSGTADYGRVYVDPGSWDFGPVPVGDKALKTFDVVNTTGEDLSIGGGQFANADEFDFDFTGPFSCLGLVVPANGSCTVSAAFTPADVGASQDTMTIVGPDGALFMPVTGTGTPGTVPPVRGNRSSGSFGHVS